MQSKNSDQEKVQQPQATNPIDKEAKTELINREIKIFDDGSALVKETQLTTVKMPSRDFISWMRKHEETKANIEKALSDEARKIAEKELKKVEEDIEKLRPYIKESEEKTKAHYEKLKKEGLISHVSNELKKSMSEINLDYMNQIWANIMGNEKDVLEALSADQKQKFLKIKLKIMQKYRGKKR